jgi:hypothetical protein
MIRLPCVRVISRDADAAGGGAFFFLDDDDRDLIALRRTDGHRWAWRCRLARASRVLFTELESVEKPKATVDPTGVGGD